MQHATKRTPTKKGATKKSPYLLKNISTLHHFPRERLVRHVHSCPGKIPAIPIEGGGGRGVLPYMFNVFVSQKTMYILHGIFGKSNEQHLYSASSCTIWRSKYGWFDGQNAVSHAFGIFEIP